jgi:hypothetical protein
MAGRGAAGMMVDIGRVYVGKFFVSEKKGLVREITAETADGMVHWRSYALLDGRSTGDSLMCSKHQIRRWAEREATEEEKATLERHALPIKELVAAAMINDVLANTPDEQLIDEICRRGYKVVRPGTIPARQNGKGIKCR